MKNNNYMKKGSRILAMILAASMVISLGADVTSTTNVYAAEASNENAEEHSSEAQGAEEKSAAAASTEESVEEKNTEENSAQGESAKEENSRKESTEGENTKEESTKDESAKEENSGEVSSEEKNTEENSSDENASDQDNAEDAASETSNAKSTDGFEEEEEPSDEQDSTVRNADYDKDYIEAANEAVDNDDPLASLIAVAQSQIGYTQQIKDDTDDTVYTLYGNWYDSDETYDDWESAFVAYCLNKADIATEREVDEESMDIPVSADLSDWLELLDDKGMFMNKADMDAEAEEYDDDLYAFTLYAGDIAFLDLDGDGDIDQAGIVTEADSDDYGLNLSRFTVVLGDYLADDADDDAAPAVASLTIGDNDNADVSLNALIGSIPVQSILANDPMTLDETTYNFRNDIKSATFEVRPEGSNDKVTYEDPSKATIGENDEIWVTLNYTLPVGSVSESQKVIYYDLPDAYKNFSDSGKVQDSTGADVGDYVIKNGRIVITFYESFARDNSNHMDSDGETIVGTEVTGKVSFHGAANQVIVDNNDKAEIKINDTISYKITITKDQTTKGDIHVTKKATSINAETGEITYQIEVKSIYGTSDKVTLEDVMTNIGFKKGSIKVQYGNNTWDLHELESEKWSTDPASVKTGEDTGDPITSFSMTLPQMVYEEGTERYYVITYTGVLPDDLKGGNVSPENKVDVSSKNSKGVDITDHAEIKSDIDGKVKKTGVDNGDGTITWTITLNQGGGSIAGYTLYDVLNIGEASDDDVIVLTKPDGTKDEITLPYKFDDGLTGIMATGKYVVTYTTTYKASASQQNIKNTATLEKGDESSSDTGEITIYPASNKVSKTGEGVKEKTDDATEKEYLELKWHISYTPGTDITEFFIWENLYNNQYFTPSQISDIRETLEKMYPGATVYIGLGPENQQSNNYTEDADGNWNGAYIKVSGVNIAKDTEIAFDVVSTAAVPGKTTNFQNNINFNNSYTDGYNNYKVAEPVIKKMDANSGVSEDSEKSDHDYSTVNGQLKWKIRVAIPEDARNQDYTIVETLPTGDPAGLVEGISYLSIKNDAGRGGEYDIATLKAGTETAVSFYTDNGNVDVKATMKNGVVTITLPKKVFGNGSDSESSFTIYVTVDLTDATTWNNVTEGKFENKVTIKDSTSKEIGSSVQEQDITYTGKKHDILKKGVDDNYSRLEYSIVVNPDGTTYLNGEEDSSLTLTDILSYQHQTYGSVARATLVASSVKVYYLKAGSWERNNDGTIEEGYQTDGELDSSLWSYTYDEKWTLATNPNPQYGADGTTIVDQDYDVKNTLTFTLPDSTPLVIKYQYYVTGNTGNNNKLTPSNTATLTAKNKTIDSSQDSTQVVIKDSTATADTSGFTVYKVDKNATSTALGGAEFELYEWTAGTDGGEAHWEKVKNSDGSDLTLKSRKSDGRVTITTDDGLKTNVAYKIVETKAPAGYQIADEYKASNGKLVFLVGSSDSNATALMPSDFDEKGGMRIVMGQTIYMKNEQIPETDIEVDKKWLDSTGKDVTQDKTTGSVNIKVYRRESVEKETSDDSSRKATLNITVKGPYGETKQESSQTYEPGSTLNLKLLVNWGGYDTSSATVDATVNGSELTGTKTYSGDEHGWSNKAITTWTYDEYTLTQGTHNLVITVSDYQFPTNWTFEPGISEKQASMTNLVVSVPEGGWKLTSDEVAKPSSITVRLKKDSRSTGNVITLSAENNWSSSVSVRADEQGQYSLELASVDPTPGYAVTIDGFNLTVEDVKNSAITDTLVGTYTIKPSDNWYIKITDLPTFGYNSAGDRVDYTYYIVEDEISGYETVGYTGNTGTTNGVITVTNKENPEYDLPETGGSGTWPWLFGGTAAVVLSLLSGAYIMRRKYM